MASSYPTSDHNCYKKDIFDMDKNDDGGVADNGVANNRAADNKVANDGVVDNNNNQGESNDQNSDGDYTEKEKEPSYLGKGFFLDKTRFLTLIILKKALLDILEDVNLRTVISDAGKKLT